MKQVVITGSTGFIGSWLTQEMLEQKINVILLVRDKKKSKYCSHPLATVIEFDSMEYQQLTQKQEDIDAVYHLAWAGVAPEEKNDYSLQIKKAQSQILWDDGFRI